MVLENIQKMFNVLNHIPKGLIKNNSLILNKGIGCWVWDTNNNKYLDMTSGIGALSTGHSHPRIINEVKNQLDNIVHAQQNCCLSHTQQELLIQKLLNIVPNNHNSFFFTNSGSESTDNAIKIARMSTNKPNIIALNKGFHGRTLAGMSITSSKISYRQGFQPLVPGVFFCNQMNKESFDNILEYQTSPDETCAVILEPIIGEGGVVQVPEHFLKHVRKRCTEENIKLIFDEVQCGVGRSGKMWASQLVNIDPDIMTFAKGIASGFQLGGVSTSKELTDSMSLNSLGGTYGGNALSTAAANATLDVIKDENLIENSNSMGNILKQELVKIPHIENVRQHGLFIAADLEEDIDVKEVIAKGVDEKVLMLSCGKNALRIIPPLIINQEECEYFTDKLNNILSNF